MRALIPLLCLFLVFLVLEYTARKNRLRREYTRRIAHGFSGLVGIILAVWTTPMVFATAAVTCFVVMVISRRKNVFSSIHGVQRVTWGEFFFPLGALAAYGVAGGWGKVYLTALLLLTVCDPLAGMIGDLQGKSSKSFAGSAVFFVSAAAILIALFGNGPLLPLLGIALAVTVTERLSPWGMDNLSIPLMSSLLLRLLF